VHLEMGPCMGKVAPYPGSGVCRLTKVATSYQVGWGHGLIVGILASGVELNRVNGYKTKTIRYHRTKTWRLHQKLRGRMIWRLVHVVQISRDNGDSWCSMM